MAALQTKNLLEEDGKYYGLNSTRKKLKQINL